MPINQRYQSVRTIAIPEGLKAECPYCQKYTIAEYDRASDAGNLKLIWWPYPGQTGCAHYKGILSRSGDVFWASFEGLIQEPSPMVPVSFLRLWLTKALQMYTIISRRMQ